VNANGGSPGCFVRTRGRTCGVQNRITRSLKDFYTLWEMFQEYGVEFVSLNEQFDTTTPMGRFALKQLLLFAELEREVTGERTKDKMRWRAEQGLWNGSNVIGYSLDDENKGVLVPNKDETALIRTIFETFVREGSAGRARNWLNAHGYRTPRYTSKRGIEHGGRPFNKQTVINILTNPVYIGKIRYEGEVYEGRHKAILPTRLFNKAQEILQRTRKTRRGPHRKADHVYVLKGLLRCGRCGAAMVPASAHGRNAHRYHYYQCTRRNHTGKTACDSKAVRAEAADELVLKYVKQIACSRSELDKIIARSSRTNRRILRQLSRDRDAQQRNLNKLRVHRDNLIASISVLGKKGAKAVAAKLETAQRDFEAAEEELSRIDQEYELISSKTIDANTMAATLGRFAQIVEGAEPIELQRLLPTVIKGVEWTEDPKTGEGLLDVYLWEEAQDPFENRAKRHSGEPLVVNGSPECQDWLPKATLFISTLGKYRRARQAKRLIHQRPDHLARRLMLS